MGVEWFTSSTALGRLFRAVFYSTCISDAMSLAKSVTPSMKLRAFLMLLRFPFLALEVLNRSVFRLSESRIEFRTIYGSNTGW